MNLEVDDRSGKNCYELDLDLYMLVDVHSSYLKLTYDDREEEH